MLASAVLLVASLLAPHAGPSADGLAAVRAVFARTEGATQAPEHVLVRRLVALGADAVPVLFTVATGEGIDALMGETDESAWLVPPDRMGEVAFGALAELPEVPVRTFLRARCTAQPVRETRAAALRVIGSQGSAEGLELFLALCRESGLELEHPSVRVPAVEGLRALARADAVAVRALEAPLAADSVLARMACEALADCPRRETVELLTRLAGRDRALDLAALEALTVLGERYAWLVGDAVAGRLRATLERGDVALKNVALEGLGRTRDLDAVPQLVASLGVRELERRAQWALEQVSGESRRRGRDAWQAWLDAEAAFWAGDGERLLAALETPSAEFTTSLRALQGHPLGRDRVAATLCGVLPSLDPGLKALACETLARIGARRAVPSLVELLFERDAAVRDAAWAALQTLTGATLPPEPRLWEDFAAGA